MGYKGLAYRYEDCQKKIVSHSLYLKCVLKCVNLFALTHLGQWNLTALPVAEESLLLEAEVHLVEFEKTNLDSTEIEVEIAEDSIITVGRDEQDELLKSTALTENDMLPAEKDLEETDVEQESCDVVDAPQVSYSAYFFFQIKQN